MRKLSIAALLLFVALASIAAQGAKDAELLSSYATKAAESREAVPVRVVALKGPTAMGMVGIMDKNEKGETVDSYTFQLEASPDAVVPLIVKGDADIAAVPANLASVLYNRTKGGVQVIGINTLGVLYIVEKGDTIHSVEDLRGRTIYTSGKGATPEYSLRYVLSANNLEIGKDVFVEWKSQHAEAVAAIANDKNGVAMLPQPFATTALLSDSSMRIALDLNKLWADKAGSWLLTGVAVVRRAFAEEHPEAVDSFLSLYKDSVAMVNSDLDTASALIEKAGIIKAAVAKKALPYCNITLITGEEMKSALTTYLGILYDFEPTSVGGKIPGDGFYYL